MMVLSSPASSTRRNAGSEAVKVLKTHLPKVINELLCKPTVDDVLDHMQRDLREIGVEDFGVFRFTYEGLPLEKWSHPSNIGVPFSAPDLPPLDADRLAARPSMNLVKPTPTPHRTETKKAEANQAQCGGFGSGDDRDIIGAEKGGIVARTDGKNIAPGSSTLNVKFCHVWAGILS
jgi:hypothetical protein